MMSLWMLVPPLAEKAPDPDDVRQGWLGFVVFVLLLVAVVFLAFSLRKHLGKVKFEEPADDDAPSRQGDGQPSTNGHKS